MGDVLFLVLRRLRLPLVTLIVVYAISIAGLVAIPGVDGEGRPWRMGYFHAFYVMSYTATTIGFGEIPHAFTDAQRLWVTVAIYLSVIGWAYTIGSVFALSRDAAFRAAAARSLFARRVAALREPYVVICGYGRSGRAVAHALDALGVRTVIVEVDPQRAASIAVQPFATAPLVRIADARRPEALREAGIAAPECRAVVALTGDDEANQTIAIGARVLDPTTRVIARVAEPLVRANLDAFGGIQVIDPFRTFATNVGMDLVAPQVLQLEEWLTGAPGAERPEPLRLPGGHWVIAGHGRFGAALAQALEHAGQRWRAFDPRVGTDAGVEERVRIVGDTERGLRESGIEQAVGVIAATDSDTVNVAVIELARRIDPRLATIVRQNRAYNEALIRAADATVTFVQSDVMVHEVIQSLTTPLLERFLALARADAGGLARAACERLETTVGNRSPALWRFDCDPSQPGIAQALGDAARPLRLGELSIDPRDRDAPLAAVALLIERTGREPPSATRQWRRAAGGVLEHAGVGARDASHGEAIALPVADLDLRAGDRILFAGAPGVEAIQRHYLLDPTPIEYVRTGIEPARSWLFRRLAARARPASTTL